MFDLDDIEYYDENIEYFTIDYGCYSFPHNVRAYVYYNHKYRSHVFAFTIIRDNCHCTELFQIKKDFIKYISKYLTK